MSRAGPNDHLAAQISYAPPCTAGASATGAACDLRVAPHAFSHTCVERRLVGRLTRRPRREGASATTAQRPAQRRASLRAGGVTGEHRGRGVVRVEAVAAGLERYQGGLDLFAGEAEAAFSAG